MIKVADKDGSGGVDLDEFIDAYNAIIQNHRHKM